MKLTWDHFNNWLEGYFTAWKTNQRQLLSGLFAEEAIYYYGPFKQPSAGKQAILDAWLANPPPEGFHYTYSPVAISTDTGVAHWNVNFRSEKNSTMLIEIDGILVIKFDAQGKCIEHKEWFVLREIP